MSGDLTHEEGFVDMHDDAHRKTVNASGRTDERVMDSASMAMLRSRPSPATKTVRSSSNHTIVGGLPL
jgi:hypothetical protein